MKTHRTLEVLIFFLIGFGSAAKGNCQIYQGSGAANGNIDGWLKAFNPNTVGANSYFQLGGSFSSQTETVFLDRTASTIRQVGSFAINFGGTGVVNGSQQVGSPAQTVPYTLTLSQSLPGGNSLYFDSTSSINQWFSPTLGRFNPFILLSAPVNVNYSLVTGGETYAGSFSYTMALALSGILVNLSISDDQNSMAISAWNNFPGTGAYSPMNGFANITAANGVNLTINTGANDNTDFYSFSSGAITATVVPEPFAMSLFCLGLSALVFARRQHH